MYGMQICIQGGVGIWGAADTYLLSSCYLRYSNFTYTFCL